MTFGVRLGRLGVLDLEGKTALVIAEGTARVLAETGAKVIVGYNQGDDRMKQSMAALPGEGHFVLLTPVDDSAALEAAEEAIRRRHGAFHVFVNSSGITQALPRADRVALDDETFDRILQINVRGVFAAIRAFAPAPWQGRWGSHQPGANLRSHGLGKQHCVLRVERRYRDYEPVTGARGGFKDAHHQHLSGGGQHGLRVGQGQGLLRAAGRLQPAKVSSPARRHCLRRPYSGKPSSPGHRRQHKDQWRAVILDE